MQSLIERLRSFAEYEADLADESKWERIEWEAADLIESQAAEIAKYKALCNQMGKSLNDAATSLEIIAMRSYGVDSYINTMHQVRGYASSRASVARKDLKAWKAMK